VLLGWLTNTRWAQNGDFGQSVSIETTT